MAKITRSSTLTFGKHKGRKLSACDSGYLEWLVANLSDSDFCLWAQAAQAELDARREEGRSQQQQLSLEEQADRLLRDAGFEP